MNDISKELGGFINDALNLKQKIDNPQKFNKANDMPSSHSPASYNLMVEGVSPEILKEYRYAQSLHNEVFEWKGITKGFLHESGFESTAFIIERFYTELPMSVSADLKAERTFIQQSISALLNLCHQLELVQVKSDVLPIIKTKKSRPHKQRPETLLEIWEPDNSGLKEEYNRQIEKLKKFNPVIDLELLSEKNEKLFWNPKRPSLSYLVGFIYTCIQKKWIKKGYSAPLLLSVLNNTFNIKMKSSTPFKGIDEYPPKEKYYQVFRNIPTNV